MIPFLLNPVIQFIILIHLALNPMRIIEVNTANQASILEATSLGHKVTTGFVCASDKDIVCVDDICNRDGKFWTIEVNGNYQSVNSQTLVGPQDKVVLKYASSYGEGR